jgi:hypothetical protein
VSSVVEDEPTFTRLAARPHLPASIGLDLVIYQNQRADLEIGTETYEALPVKDLQGAIHLFEAVADGLLITRRWKRGVSGVHVATDTSFEAHPAASLMVQRNGWPLRQIVPGRSAADLEAAVAVDRRYPPWVRVPHEAVGS